VSQNPINRTRSHARPVDGDAVDGDVHRDHAVDTRADEDLPIVFEAVGELEAGDGTAELRDGLPRPSAVD